MAGNSAAPAADEFSQVTAGRSKASPKSRGFALPPAYQQAILMLAILAFAAIFARVGLGSITRILYIFAGIGTGVFYIRRSPWQYVTITLWFWTLTPLARRLIDLYAGFDPTSLMLATPNVMTLLMLPTIMNSRELLKRRETAVGLFVLCPIFYGVALNFVEGDAIPGAVAAADWVGPLLYYFYVIANWRRIREAEALLRGFLTANGIIILAYSFHQFFSPTPWDAAWVLNSGMTTIGKALPYQLRSFGPLNAPGTLAIWTGALLLLSVHFRTRISAFLVPAYALLLLMTLVRSSTGAVVLGLILSGLMGRGSTLKSLAGSMLAMMVVVFGLSAVNPDVATIVGSRFETLYNLGQDTSAIERTELYRLLPDVIEANPFGLGIGAIGRGAVAGNTNMVVVDSGPLAVYLTLGWAAGSCYLAGIALVLGQAVLAAQSTKSSATVALAVTAVATTANFVFTNMTGLYTVIIWFCAAYASALALAARAAETADGR